MAKMLKTVCIAALFAAAATSAQAGVAYGNATTYNTSYGRSVPEKNTATNTAQRQNDSENTGPSMSQQTGAEYMSTLSGSGTETGVGFGTASATDDSLNVVTEDNGNTLNATQTNDGNQIATVSLNGH